MKPKKPEHVIFYQNFKGAIYQGNPQQVKNLMTAFCQYAFDGIENPTVTPDISMIFEMMKASIDADRKHYAEVCEQNRRNALRKTGLIVTGYVDAVVDAGEYVTVTIKDEDFRFYLDDKEEETKAILKDLYSGDYVEVEIKGGQPIGIRLAVEK